jgi:peroxiredoxin
MRLVAALLMLSFGGLATTAPDLAFTVPTQGQRTVSDFRGKVVALEFIYTTCTHCVPAVQTLQKLEQELGNQGFQAIAVAFNPNAEVLVEDFTKEQHVTIPVGWSLGNDVSAFLGYGPADRFVVPQIVLIDREGKIRSQTKAQGEDTLRSEPVLRQKILELLHPKRPLKQRNADSEPGASATIRRMRR